MCQFDMYCSLAMETYHKDVCAATAAQRGPAVLIVTRSAAGVTAERALVASGVTTVPRATLASRSVAASVSQASKIQWYHFKGLKP